LNLCSLKLERILRHLIYVELVLELRFSNSRLPLFPSRRLATHIAISNKMAELGAIASIVGIAAAGAKISMTLYELGSTVRSAKRDINKVAVSIATFCSVLQQLASTLEKARSARFSVSAIETTQEILDRCTELFSEIEEVVKKLEMGQQGGRSPKQTSIGHVARVKWVFQRAKVQRLHAELESMKLTLTLMRIALNLAEKIRARR
jgi:hypothetical protein